MEIISFGYIGYETTSSCLAYTSYLLAINPDKQDILYQEIENYYYENPVSVNSIVKRHLSVIHEHSIVSYVRYINVL